MDTCSNRNLYSNKSSGSFIFKRSELSKEQNNILFDETGIQAQMKT